MKSRCPNCKKVIDRVLREQGRREGFHPFCCERCKLIDLGRWLDSDYRILTELKDDEQSESDEENSGQSKVDGG